MDYSVRRSWSLLYRALVRLPLPNGPWSLVISILFWPESRTFVRWDEAKGLFLVRSGEHQIFIPRRARLYRYLPGVIQRIFWLGAEYGLDKVAPPPRNGDLTLDIGSNVGEFALLLESFGCEVIAFEPDPQEFAALKSNICSQSVASAVALWNHDGTADFFDANDHGDSSLIRPPTAAGPSTKVRTMRLDTFMESSGYQKRRIKILKLEAEGAEPEILDGATKTLERVEWILADVGFERGEKEESTLPAVVHALLPKGFELVSVLPDRLVAIFKNKNLAHD